MDQLSITAAFDDLVRCDGVLTDGTAEIEFRRYVAMQDEWRHQWLSSIQEAQRLQRELDKSLQTMADLETKLFHARRLLEMENKARRDAEQDRDAIEKKMCQVREFLLSEQDLKDETRNKLAFLNVSSRKRKSNKYIEEKYGNDINSTGSFLSNLSLTQSEDDFLDVGIGHTKQWKKHRPSYTNAANASFAAASADKRKSRRSERKSVDALRSRSSVLELSANDKIVATTKLSIPQGNGPIQATSVIEAVPSDIRPLNEVDNQFEQNDFAPTTPKRSSMKFVSQTPSAPPVHEINNNPKLLLNLQGRQHGFAVKTFLRSDQCAYCLKKIRFGTIALKCRNCRLCVHTDCKIQLAVACVPKSQGTPTIKAGKMGDIGDYAPSDGPMVPGLIVHCINEIETRGLSEEGIYRVSGSERDIKALKERFLRGKSIPPLNNIDIHVICGCVKDFLRSLREPLIPTNLWKNFSNAVQCVDDNEAVQEIYASIQRLPQPNRDTLALLIQHLQRVAECKTVKMPISNLAKIFGPTVLGYSSADPDRYAIYAETMIQANVMEHLLNIPTDYWGRFLKVETPEIEHNNTRQFFATPTLRNGTTILRKERKFFTTPPYSAKKK